MSVPTNELDLGFGRVQLPEGVSARIARTSDGGAVIGFLHNVAGELGRVFLVQRPGGLQVDAEVAAQGSPEDTAWRRSLVEPVVKAISDAIDKAIAARRAKSTG